MKDDVARSAAGVVWLSLDDVAAVRLESWLDPAQPVAREGQADGVVDAAFVWAAASFEVPREDANRRNIHY